MKRTSLFNLSVVLIIALILGSGVLPTSHGQAQGMASPQVSDPLEVHQAQALPLGDLLTNEFTYQGRLTDSVGAPVPGPCDFRFSLYQSSAGNDPIGTSSLYPTSPWMRAISPWGLISASPSLLAKGATSKSKWIAGLASTPLSARG